MRIQPAVVALVEARSPLARLFWGGVGMVACALLAAFWMLCVQQVRQAEVRHAAVRMQHMAVADCLQSVPRSTWASCSGSVAGAPTAVAVVQPVGSPSWQGAIPVSYQIR